jgi:hypothetical protein
VFFHRTISGPPPENFEKLDALRGVFPPSQKLKDIPIKCTFWVNFVEKTLRSDKKAIYPRHKGT